MDCTETEEEGLGHGIHGEAHKQTFSLFLQMRLAMLFVCLFDFCFKIYIPITTVTNKCVCWCNAQSFQSDENHSKAPLQNDDSLCFILSCNTWYIFITLETLTQVICLWLHLQPTILVFKELNIKMFAK